MRLEYDPVADAAYIRLRGGKVQETEEIASGIHMDVGEDGRPIGFEILDASQVLDGVPHGVQFVILGENAPARPRA